MDFTGLAKIVELSPLLALTAIFSFIFYKVGNGYIQFVNKILDKYSGDVQNLKTTIDTYQQHNKDAHENIIAKVDNFRQITIQEFNNVAREDEAGHKEIMKKLEDLQLDALRSQLENSKRSENNGK